MEQTKKKLHSLANPKGKKIRPNQNKEYTLVCSNHHWLVRRSWKLMSLIQQVFLVSSRYKENKPAPRNLHWEGLVWGKIGIKH